MTQVEPLPGARYIEQLGRAYAPATVKQHLAALRQLFAWLVGGQVIPRNPAGAVRGPKPLITTGKPPVLPAAAWRLLDRIDPSPLIGLRDRARSGLLVYGLARISAARAMRGADYDTQGKRSFFRLHEKGGTYLVMPAPQRAPAWTDDDIARAGLGGQSARPPVSVGGQTTGDGPAEPAAVRSRGCLEDDEAAGAAGGPGEGGAHSCRGTGITEYLRAGGTLETAARIAGQASTRTTQLYNRSPEEVSLDEIERIYI